MVSLKMKRRKHAALGGRQMFLQLSDWYGRCQDFIMVTKDLKFLIQNVHFSQNGLRSTKQLT